MTRPSLTQRLGKLIGPAALAVAATLATAGIALAAGPVKGAKYSGRVNVNATLTVSFKVSRSGKGVTSLKVSPSLPNRCGYGGPPPTQTSRSARIAHSKFTAKITETASSGTVIGTAKVTGKFLAGGKGKGSIVVNLPNALSCNGSFSYSTKVKKKR
jgi:hypothetical protein